MTDKEKIKQLETEIKDLKLTFRAFEKYVISRLKETAEGKHLNELKVEIIDEIQKSISRGFEP